MFKPKLFRTVVLSMILTAGGAGAPSAVLAQSAVAAVPFSAESSSIVPANGDLNPYAAAFVPPGFPAGGKIAAGDVLVTNFNNIKNLQGTGKTIVSLTPNGAVVPLTPAGQKGTAKTFFTSSLGGLSTALGVLKGGFVIVGNLPTTDGTFATVGQGALQVVNSKGVLVAKFTDASLLDSPWGLAVNDKGATAQIFVTNAISTKVTRLDLTVGSNTVTLVSKREIASGYAWEPNSGALVVGPTGLAYDSGTDTLYVASTDDNAIYSIAKASTTTAGGKGKLVYSDAAHLRGPVGLAQAPNGHLFAVNGDAINADPTHPSEIVEFTTGGKFIAESNLDAAEGGGFGIGIAAVAGGVRIAAVDDVPNVVLVFTLPTVP